MYQKLKKIMRLYLALAATCFISSNAWASEDIGFRSNAASAMLHTINAEHQKNLIYINALTLSNKTYTLSLPQIREKVLKENKHYFIDFSAIYNDREKKATKDLLRSVLGVGFSSDWLIIGPYKKGLIYTPLKKENDPLLKIALSRNAVGVTNKMGRFPSTTDKMGRFPAIGNGAGNSETTTLPHIAFYLDVNRPITDRECTFPNSQVWNRGERAFCNQANIALIYRINLMRSLKLGTVGSATPDAKLVRISLDEESAGAGLQLNNKLNTNKYSHSGKVASGWAYSYSTSAIAKDYKFAISASNTNAAILKTYPASNLNTNYEIRDTSGFEVGVTAGGEAGKEGPKIKLEPKYSYNQSRTLVYKTEDYRVERSAKNAQNITFTWARDQHSTAASLLAKKTGPVWNSNSPVDLKRIKPISYQGFVPNFDVVFKATPDTKGSTTFTVDSSVNIWPVYTAAFKHYYVVGGHLSFQGKDQWQQYRRISQPTSFEVDWNHSIFSGGRPVNLQLGGFNNKCISFGNNAAIEIAECDLKSTKQSFIYDQHGRYISAINSNKCLDINNLNVLQSCNANLSQRWTWVNNSDQLQNEFQKLYLAHDTWNNKLIAARGNSGNINLRTITAFTDIYSL